MADWITARADWCRGLFDRIADRWGSVLLVSVLAVLAGRTGTWVASFAEHGCSKLPFSFIDFELTFSADAFAALLRSVEPCRDRVLLSLITVDDLFAIVYPFFLSALYLWAERYRRTRPYQRALSAPPDLHILSSIFVLLPFVAGILDIFAENLPLYFAGRGNINVPLSSSTHVLVALGSTGAALKWTLLGVFSLGLIGMVIRGPRGAVLWQLRFSLLGVLIGALPLFILPQGQDILQRLAEGAHPYSRIVGAVIALTGAALIVWYCGRVLSLVRSRQNPENVHDEWRRFFERHLPRVLGVAVLALSGAAFAQAGLALTRFAAVVGVAYLGVTAFTHFRRGTALRTMGRTFVPGTLRSDALLSERVAGAIIACALGVLIVWPASFRPLRFPYEAGTQDRRALRLAAWLCIIAAWGIFIFVSHRRQLLGLRSEQKREELDAQLQHGYSPDSVPRAAKRAVIIAAVVSAIFFGLFTFLSIPVGRWLGPLVILAITVSNAVFIGSCVTYIGQKLRIPLMTALIAVALIMSRWNDNHEIRTMQPTKAVAKTDTLGVVFERWLHHADSADSAGEIPVVLVAGSGGGLRAAYWTAVTLATLQDRDSTFARHVFAISTVSGSSLGAAVFAGIVRDLRSAQSVLDCHGTLRKAQSFASDTVKQPGPRDTTRTATCARLFMNGDFLSPVLAKMVAPDFLQWFIPIPIHAFDRATALENSWEQSYADAMNDTTLSKAYLSLYDSRDSVDRMPFLILNSTHVQTGKRYITSPIIDSNVFLDAPDVHRALGSDMPLSVAVHNTARFPFVSPAGRLERRDGQSYGALVDGGYFENSGLASLGDLRRALADALSKMSDSALKQRAKFVVVYLCNDPQPCRHDAEANTILVTKRSLGAEWLSPLLALLSTRDARGSMARAQINVDAKNDRFFQLNVCDSLTIPKFLTVDRDTVDSAVVTRAQERVINPPLGWLLSHLARDWMDASLNLNPSKGVLPIDSAHMQALKDSVWRTKLANCRARNFATLDSIPRLLHTPAIAATGGGPMLGPRHEPNHNPR